MPKYYVKGPRGLLKGGVLYQVGDELEITEKEAAGCHGTLALLSEKPKPVVDEPGPPGPPPAPDPVAKPAGSDPAPKPPVTAKKAVPKRK